MSGPDQYLQRWDYQGQLLLSLCLTQTLELGDDYDREDVYLSNGFCTEAESQAARELVYSAQCLRLSAVPCWDIIQEEAAACFAGDKSAEETARIIQSRVSIYLGEQS